MALTIEDWKKDYEKKQIGKQIFVFNKGKLVGSFNTEAEANEYIERSVQIDLRNGKRYPNDQR